MNTKILLLTAAISVGVLAGCFYGRTAAADQASQLSGRWQVTSVACASGQTVSKDVTDLAATMVIHFKNSLMAKTIQAGNCTAVSVGRYKVAAGTLNLDRAIEGISCQGQPIHMASVSDGVDTFSVSADQLIIREQDPQGAICSAPGDRVVYTCARIWSF